MQSGTTWETQLRDEPWNVDELEGARHLVRGWSSGAVLHLALPVDAAVPLDAHVDHGRWCYRGVSVAVGGRPTDEALELARATQRPGDRYLNPAGAVEDWVKILRSGTQLVAYGAALLCGVPTLVADLNIPAEVIREVCRNGGKLRALQMPIVTTQGYLLDGGDELWVLRDPNRNGDVAFNYGERPVDAGRLIPELVATFGTPDVEAVELGSRLRGTLDVEYLARLDGWEIIVPSTLGDEGTTIGVPADEVIYGSVDTDLPVGFRVVGRSMYEDAVVAEHSSGIRVLLRVSGGWV